MQLTRPLEKHHNRANFDCGNESLNRYIREVASQDVKRGISYCWVLANEQDDILGYFTLSNSIIRIENLPLDLKKSFPKSGLEFPATLIGRLARDLNVQSKGIGRILLMEALELCYKVANSEIASIGVLVDPIDENAIAFYRQFGFEMLPEINRMFLPMGVVRKLIEGGKTF